MTCVASPPLYWVGFHWGNVSLESFFSRIRLPASILVTILLACTTEETKKKCTLNVNVSSAKVLMGTLFLRLLMQTGLPFYVIIWTMWRSSNLQGKDSTFNSQLFQGPEKCSRTWNRPPPPFPTSAVKGSTNWPYPAAVKFASESTVKILYWDPTCLPRFEHTPMTGLLKMPICLFGRSAWKEFENTLLVIVEFIGGLV